jgi:prepilin-type N-terminal cleavage/methylation domain-containing protein
MKGEKGFSFIEVVIALAVLGIIAVGFLGGLTTASKGLMIADERETANNLAEAQIEHIKRQAYDIINNPPQYSLVAGFPSSYSIDQPLAVRLDRDGDGDTSTDEGIQKITVTVRHGDKEVLTLEDYKVN